MWPRCPRTVVIIAGAGLFVLSVIAWGWGMTSGSVVGAPIGGGDMPGRMMGSVMAGAPGPRISPAQSAGLGGAAPSGATVDRARNRISFRTRDVRLWVLASPGSGPDMTFRVSGLADPTIAVPQGARVTLQLGNADRDTSHGWLITPLGDAGAAGMPYEPVHFVASLPGRDTYLCPVPGHAARGMYGTLVVGVG